MERSENIEHPERFEKEKLPFWKKVQLFLVNNILWIPIVAIVIGLFSFFALYGYYSGNRVSLNVDLGEVIKPRPEEPQKDKSAFERVLDDIAAKNNVPRKKRYDEIVNGRDIISTSFGQLTYVDDGKEVEKETDVADTVATDTISQPTVEQPPVRVIMKEVYLPADTLEADTLVEEPHSRNPFASARLVSHHVEYVSAYIYGDQPIGRNTRVKLRLGEPLKIDGRNIPRGTVFTGRASVTDNAIHVVVNRIERYNVSYEVYDYDYSYGIPLERPKNEDMEEAITQSAYRSSSRGVADLPYDIARDVTRAIVNRKQRKQQAIQLNDGHPVFLAQK